MIIELVATMCVAGRPDCAIVRIETPYLSIEACQTASQSILQTAVVDHPSWKITRFHCEVSNAPEKRT